MKGGFTVKLFFSWNFLSALSVFPNVKSRISNDMLKYTEFWFGISRTSRRNGKTFRDAPISPFPPWQHIVADTTQKTAKRFVLFDFLCFVFMKPLGDINQQEIFLISLFAKSKMYWIVSRDIMNVFLYLAVYKVRGQIFHLILASKKKWLSWTLIIVFVAFGELKIWRNTRHSKTTWNTINCLEMFS